MVLKIRINLERVFLLLALTLASILVITSDADANMFNKFKEGFYFEKYKTADEAKEALLKLHPIGSDVEGLVKTLERAGAVVKERNLESYKKFREYDKWWEDGTVKVYGYEYHCGILIINPLQWGGAIMVNKNDNIVNFGISKHYMGL